MQRWDGLSHVGLGLDGSWWGGGSCRGGVDHVGWGGSWWGGVGHVGKKK